MSFLDSALAFVEGIKSAMDVSGAAVRSTISDAISNGIESAFRRIRGPLEQSMMKIALMFVSVFFIAWGFAVFLDNFLPYDGIGFVLVGAFLGAIVLLFLQEKASAGVC